MLKYGIKSHIQKICYEISVLNAIIKMGYSFSETAVFIFASTGCFYFKFLKERGCFRLYVNKNK